MAIAPEDAARMLYGAAYLLAQRKLSGQPQADVARQYTKNQMQDAAKMGAAAGAAKQRQGHRQAATAQQQASGRERRRL